MSAIPLNWTTEAAAQPVIGSVYFDTATTQAKIYTGDSWVAFSSAPGPSILKVVKPSGTVSLLAEQAMGMHIMSPSAFVQPASGLKHFDSGYMEDLDPEAECNTDD